MASVLKNWRKFIAAVVGAIGVAVSLGVLSGSASKWVAIIVAALSAAGVGAVPNDPMPAILPPDPGPPAK